MTTPATEPVDRTEPGDGYRPNVGIALFAPSGHVFVGRRCAGPDAIAADHAWQMPQGGIDAGETPRQAALRELYEETGIRSVVPLGETQGWLRYDLPEAALKRSWKGRWRGQAQKWFAFGFTGDEAEIDVARPGGGAHKPEFDAWRWEALATTPTLIIPFKRPVYERVVAAFAGLTAWRVDAGAPLPSADA